MTARYEQVPRHWKDWWLGEPLFRHHPIKWLVWLLDEALDRVPGWTPDGFRLRGGHGCRWQMHRFWWVEEDSP